MRKTLLGTCLLLIIGLVAASSAPAASVPFKGKPWKKGSKIRVYSQIGPRYDKAVNMAIANYAKSRTGANISFVRVKRKSQAQVLIKSMNNFRLPVGITSSQGYVAKKPIVVSLNLKLGGFERQTKGYTEGGTKYLPDPHAVTMLIAHELGHVVGLDHPRKASTCTIANPGFFKACKQRGDADFWGNEGPRTFSCDFVLAVDAKVLAAKYGGKAKKITGKTICRMDDGKVYVRAAKPSPAAIGASASDAQGSNPVIRWTPQSDAEIFINRYELACSAVTDNSDSRGLQAPTNGGLIDMNAGSFEDTTPITDMQTGEPVTAPLNVCYRVEVIYGKSRGSQSAVTLVDMLYQP